MRFAKGNFAHLTGVITNLSPLEFFEKCFSQTVTGEDFSWDTKHNKTTIKRKLKSFKCLPDFFSGDLYIQEDFSRNNVICKIAISDNEITIGFTGPKTKLYPKTLISGNHLDVQKAVKITAKMKNK